MQAVIKMTTADQAAELIEVAILAGEFEPGGKLPPEHKMAAMLGVSRSTYREARQKLIARGILIAIPGVGTFVADTERSRSIETLPSLYLYAKVAAHKVELVKHFLDFRRSMSADVFALVCSRTAPEDVRWVTENLQRVTDTALFEKNVEETLNQEFLAIYCGAQRANAFCIWNTFNALRRFLRVAMKEIAAVSSLDQVSARAQALLAFIKKRDHKGVREYFHTVVEQEDYRLVKALEDRLMKAELAANATKKVPSIPLAASTGSSTGVPLRSDGSSATKLSYAPPSEPSQPATQTVAVEPEPLAPAAQPEAPPAPENGPETLPPEKWKADPEKYPRTDPRAWHPWFYGWCRRNLGCNPWDDPEYVPPGDPSPYGDDG